MKYIREINLSDFNFWSGARDTAKYLTSKDFDIIEGILAEIWADKIPTETEINDLFWFEDDTIAEWLGYENFDDLMANREAESEC